MRKGWEPWKTLGKRVYRMGAFAFANLAPAKKYQGAFSRALCDIVGSNRTLADKVVGDYLALSLKDGAVYSVPPSLAIKASPSAGPWSDSETEAQDETSVVEDPLVFKVVKTGAARLKIIQTLETNDIRKMKLPVLVQPMHIWKYSGNPLAAQSVYPVGSPYFKDALGLATSQHLLGNMVEWTVADTSDVVGTLAISNPLVLSKREWKLYLLGLEVFFKPCYI